MFATNVYLKIIVGFYFLNCFFESWLISVRIICVGIIMFVRNLAGFKLWIFFVKNRTVMPSVLSLQCDTDTDCLDHIEISEVNRL